MEGVEKADQGPPTQGRRILGLDAEERQQARREQILEAALTVFAAHGYAHTSVEQVCQSAGVSTKSFYRLFDNREDLYLAVYDRFRTAVFERMMAVAELLAQRSPRDEAVAEDILVENLVAAYFSDSRNALVIQGPARAVTPTIERIRRDTRRAAADFLEGTWRQFGLTGDFGGVAVAVIGGIFDQFTSALVDGEALDDQQLERLTADVKRFYRAVRAGLEVSGQGEKSELTVLPTSS